MDRIKNKEIYLLDMDGTIYFEDKLIDGALTFIQTLNQKQKKYVFMTNNSSVNYQNYIEKLKKLGVPCNQENMFSSGMATGMFLKNNRAGKRIFLVGTKALEEELMNYGITITDKDPDIVVVGFDRELNYSKLEKACYFLDKGLEFLATNPDLVYPLKEGRYLPDCGLICHMLTVATKRTPTYIGKPNRYMVDILSNYFKIPSEKIVIIGDRLYTDIATGVNANITSILVLSGETTINMVKDSSIKPDLIFNSVKDLIQLL